MSKRCPNLVAAMMAKNEAARIVETTLLSIKDYCSGFVLYDTGSTDNTIDIVRNFCIENGIKFHLKQGQFVNFCISRNVMLDFCEEIYPGKDTFLLLLDAHDELQEGNKLVEYINKFNGTFSGFYLTQRWWSGQNLDSYYNVRLIRTGFGWRYKGVVHEYIMTPLIDVEKKNDKEIVHRLEGIFLYQNRVNDDDKSFHRFRRDKDLLYAEHIKDPTEARTTFYLAQTCGCLGQTDEAYKYYLKRIKQLGFYEEIYQSFYRLGEISQVLKHDWEESMMWYLKAFQHSQRAEPLVKIAEYYKDNNLNGDKISEWHTSYMYAQMACQLIFPVNQILFVNRRDYTYKRWHILGISAYYVGRYKEGKEACIKAIEAENNKIDLDNLKFYLDKELSVLQSETLSRPSLIAMTMGDKEVRTTEEVDVKYNKNEFVGKIIDTILEEKKAQNKPVNNNIAVLFKQKNISSVIGSIENKNSIKPAEKTSKQPATTRREKLKNMIKNKTALSPVKEH